MAVLDSLDAETIRQPPSFFQLYIVWDADKPDEKYVFPLGTTLETAETQYDSLVETVTNTLKWRMFPVNYSKPKTLTLFKIPSKEIIHTHTFG